MTWWCNRGCWHPKQWPRALHHSAHPALVNSWTWNIPRKSEEKWNGDSVYKNELKSILRNDGTQQRLMRDGQAMTIIQQSPKSEGAECRLGWGPFIGLTFLCALIGPTCVLPFWRGKCQVFHSEAGVGQAAFWVHLAQFESRLVPPQGMRMWFKKKIGEWMKASSF